MESSPVQPATIASRRCRIEKILEELRLSAEHLDILEANPSKDSPYHNNEHLFTVALNCDEAARFYALPVEGHRVLFLAALYHDYNHSAGVSSDTINISRAISGAVEHISRLEKAAVEELDEVAGIIHATIQPPTMHNTDIGLLHRIIMDADMMQSCEPDAEAFLAGLSVELKKEVNWSSTKVFLEGYEPKTSWGKQKLAALLEHIRF